MGWTGCFPSKLVCRDFNLRMKRRSSHGYECFLHCSITAYMAMLFLVSAVIWMR